MDVEQVVVTGLVEHPSHSDAPPDWATHLTDVTCPLCGYNLRGLTEPRCPECGHQFAWRALLDESSWRHPYLFEHHPRRPVWSFLRTFFASLLPRRFFGQNVRPEHTPRPRMLVLFWVSSGLATVLIPTLVVTAMTLPGLYNEHQARIAVVAQLRARERAQFNALPSGHPYVVGRLRTFGSLQRYLDATYPQPTFWDTARGTATWRVTSLWRDLAQPVPVLLLWPWLSFLALMLFPQTMQAHRVLPVQVLRVVVYSAAAAVPLVLVAAAAIDFATKLGDTVRAAAPLIVWRMSPLMITTLLLAFPVLGYRLAIGYRHYLRFAQPIATVLLAQVVVMLASLAIFYWVVVPLFD